MQLQEALGSHSLQEPMLQDGESVRRQSRQHFACCLPLGIPLLPMLIRSPGQLCHLSPAESPTETDLSQQPFPQRMGTPVPPSFPRRSSLSLPPPPLSPSFLDLLEIRRDKSFHPLGHCPKCL